MIVIFCNFDDLKNKEMICISDGLKIGYVDNIEFDIENYNITYLISYGKSRFFGIFGKSNDIKIKCSDIKIIGEDIILVNDYKSDILLNRKKDTFLSKFFE